MPASAKHRLIAGDSCRDGIDQPDQEADQRLRNVVEAIAAIVLDDQPGAVTRHKDHLPRLPHGVLQLGL